MNIINRLLRWLSRLLSPRVKGPYPRDNKPLNQTVLYEEAKYLDAPIPNSDVEKGIIYCIAHRGKSRWLLLLCPCGCSDVITLSVQRGHIPRWSISVTAANLPTLHPSIWRDQGCFSHFWVKGGEVFWCEDTGSAIRDSHK